MAKITLIQRNPVTSVATSSNVQRYAQAGQTIGNAITDYNKQQAKIRSAADDMEVAKKNSELNLRLNKSFNGVKNKYQNDPYKGDQDFKLEIDSVINDVSNSMTESAKEKFIGQSYKYADTYKMKSDNWANTQNAANIFTNYEESSNNYNEQFYAAGKSLDEEAFATGMASYTNNLNLYSSSIEPSKLKELNEKDKSQFVNSYLTAGARDKPTETLALIKSGRFDDYMTQEEKDGLIDSTGMRILQNKNVENRLMTEKPFEYMATQGSPAPEIDVTNPTQTANTLTDRELYVNNARREGLTMDFLQDHEVDGFYESYKKDNVNEFIENARRIDINSSSTANNQIARQLSKKDPVMGAAFAFAADDRDLSMDIVNGSKILSNKTISTMPKDAKVVELFNSVYGNSIKNSTVTSQMIEASKAAYATKLYNSGSEHDESTLKEVFKQVVGDVAKINGGTTLTFRDRFKKVVTGDQLEDNFKTLHESDFKNTMQDMPYIGNEVADLDVVKDYAMLSPVADGQYNLLMKTTNSFLTDKKGTPYVLDMKTIYKRRQAEGNLASIGFLSNILSTDKQLTGMQKLREEVRQNKARMTPEQLRELERD